MILIDPLDEEPVGADLSLGGVGGDHQAGIIGMNAVRAGGVGDAHLRDESIPVHVVGRIFGELEVPVVVGLSSVAVRFVGGTSEDAGDSIGVGSRDDVDASRIDEGFDRFLGRMGHDPFRHSQGDFAADGMGGDDVADDEDRGPTCFIRSTDSDEMDLSLSLRQR